jgi:nucleotide-binding universal stress UspA family protein
MEGIAMFTKYVLVPLDDSGESRGILPQLDHLLESRCCHLILFHVIPPDTVYWGDVPHLELVAPAMPLAYATREELVHATQPLDLEQKQAMFTHPMLARLELDAQPLRARGFEVSCVIHSGEPGEEIVRFVEQEKVDLVAMVAHGWHGENVCELGHVAHEVYQRVCVPVLLMHPHEAH